MALSRAMIQHGLNRFKELHDTILDLLATKQALFFNMVRNKHWESGAGMCMTNKQAVSSPVSGSSLNNLYNV